MTKTRRTSPHAKLDMAKAREIRLKAREMMESRNPPMAALTIHSLLGAEYGVSQRAIQNVCYGRTYKEDNAG